MSNFKLNPDKHDLSLEGCLWHPRGTCRCKGRRTVRCSFCDRNVAWRSLGGHLARHRAQGCVLYRTRTTSTIPAAIVRAACHEEEL